MTRELERNFENKYLEIISVFLSSAVCQSVWGDWLLCQICTLRHCKIRSVGLLISLAEQMLTEIDGKTGARLLNRKISRKSAQNI